MTPTDGEEAYIFHEITVKMDDTLGGTARATS